MALDDNLRYSTSIGSIMDDLEGSTLLEPVLEPIERGRWILSTPSVLQGVNGVDDG